MAKWQIEVQVTVTRTMQDGRELSSTETLHAKLMHQQVERETIIAVSGLFAGKTYREALRNAEAYGPYLTRKMTELRTQYPMAIISEQMICTDPKGIVR